MNNVRTYLDAIVRLTVNTHGHNPYFCYQLKGQEVQWSSLLEILILFHLYPCSTLILEYVNWDPHQKKDIERLAGVQKLGLNVGIKTYNCICKPAFLR